MSHFVRFFGIHILLCGINVVYVMQLTSHKYIQETHRSVYSEDIFTLHLLLFLNPLLHTALPAILSVCQKSMRDEIFSLIEIACKSYIFKRWHNALWKFLSAGKMQLCVREMEKCKCKPMWFEIDSLMAILYLCIEVVFFLL